MLAGTKYGCKGAAYAWMRSAGAACVLVPLSASFAGAGEPIDADTVIRNAVIYTADSGRHMSRALAMRDGRIVYVGTDAGADRLAGPRTRVEDAGGRLVVPGLVDAHIHPVGLVDPGPCSLDNKSLSLAAITEKVRLCIARAHIARGSWVVLVQWDPVGGNAPTGRASTLRASLDLASGDNPVMLIGTDGHHRAFNSVALAEAVNARGQVVGYSRSTIDTDFPAYRLLIGVDALGEPDGTLTEDAKNAIPAPDMQRVFYGMLIHRPEEMTERLNRAGVTAIQDAKVAPDLLPLYDSLLAGGHMTVRARLMQFYVPESFLRPDGRIDYDRILDGADAIRRKYAGNDLVRADGIKIFADGTLEGNPYAAVPTQPNSPAFQAYLQPIFRHDPSGRLAIAGYVDLDSADCREVRARKQGEITPGIIKAFAAAHGYEPAQCAISTGRFQHDPAVFKEYALRAHRRGYTLHIHAIGDAAVHLAIDAIEAARRSDGIATQQDSVAHLQQVLPDDVARLGRDRIFLAYTYSWMDADPDEDMAVIPFIVRVSGDGHAALHPPGSRYDRDFYPARSTDEAGAILAAGSDAPVGVADPQPFVNMQVGITRTLPVEPGTAAPPAANPWERLDIRTLLDAYTINGARAMGRAGEFGSLEVGKSADLIILDQNILELADAGRADRIGQTKVLETWFKGRLVFAAKPDADERGR